LPLRHLSGYFHTYLLSVGELNFLIMDISTIQTLILSTLTDFGASVLVILTSVISLGLAYLIFRWGWKQVQGSLTLSGRSNSYAPGEYMANLPGMTEADKAYYRSKKYKGNQF